MNRTYNETESTPYHHGTIINILVLQKLLAFDVSVNSLLKYSYCYYYYY